MTKLPSKKGNINLTIKITWSMRLIWIFNYKKKKDISLGTNPDISLKINKTLYEIIGVYIQSYQKSKSK